MTIASIHAAVEHIKPERAADAYAGQESLTYVRCKVTTRDGITGIGVTGRFLSAEVAHLLNGGFAETAKGLDPLDIEAVTATLAKNSTPGNRPACSYPHCRRWISRCGTSRGKCSTCRSRG